MKKLLSKVCAPGTTSTAGSFGLLILRIFAGATMAIAHGWGKLKGFSEMSSQFPDPIGVGSPTALGLAVFAEFFCSIAIVLGLFTRAAAIPLLITMLVAAFMIHGSDPFQKKELALFYGTVFLTLVFTGAGKFSIDAKLGR